MMSLKHTGRILGAIGLVFLATFNFTRKSVTWPPFFTKYAALISCITIGIGFLVTIIYILALKDFKKAWSSILYTAAILGALILLFYLDAM